MPSTVSNAAFTTLQNEPMNQTTGRVRGRSVVKWRDVIASKKIHPDHLVKACNRLLFQLSDTESSPEFFVLKRFFSHAVALIQNHGNGSHRAGGLEHAAS